MAPCFLEMLGHNMHKKPIKQYYRLKCVSVCRYIITRQCIIIVHVIIRCDRAGVYASLQIAMKADEAGLLRERSVKEEQIYED